MDGHRSGLLLPQLEQACRTAEPLEQDVATAVEDKAVLTTQGLGELVKVGAATTAQLVWILGARLPEPESTAQSDE